MLANAASEPGPRTSNLLRSGTLHITLMRSMIYSLICYCSVIVLLKLLLLLLLLLLCQYHYHWLFSLS